MTNESKTVPAAALCFTSEFELADNGDDAKTAPFSMVARTGDSISHWFWGDVVHDLSGMHIGNGGNRISIDYNHDPKEIVGYANRFDTESGDLKVSGALVPTKYNNRASEIVELQKAGVPYQSSINFGGGDKTVIEQIPEGSTQEINGRTFAGPITVIREWTLQNVAITPVGADSGTSTNFSKDEKVTVTMTKPNDEAVSPEAELAVDSLDNDTAEATEVEVAVEAEATEAAVAVAEVEEAEEVEVETSELAAALAAYAVFGPAGLQYAADGLSVAEAHAAHLSALTKENADLKKRLSDQKSEGESEAVSFSEGDNGKPKGVGKLGVFGKKK